MSIFKVIAGRFAANLNIPFLLHKNLYKNDLTILMYHGVIKKPLQVQDWCFISSEVFLRQMLYIKDHFDVVSLSDAMKYLKNRKTKIVETKKPKLVITFDDGYQNNYDVVFPFLCDLNIPATIFVNTKFVDTDQSIWFCMLNEALNQSKQKSIEWENVKYDVTTSVSKAVTSSKLQAVLKEKDHVNLLKSLKDIGIILNYDVNSSLSKDSPFHILSSDSIRTMQKSGLIEFGAHTATHTILTSVDPAIQQQEINKSIQDVESITGEKCRFFSYPNGRKKDYDCNAINQMKNNDILAAVTTIHGANTEETPLLELKRYGIGSDTQMPLFKCMVHHLTVKIDGLFCMG